MEERKSKKQKNVKMAFIVRNMALEGFDAALKKNGIRKIEVFRTTDLPNSFWTSKSNVFIIETSTSRMNTLLKYLSKKIDLTDCVTLLQKTTVEEIYKDPMFDCGDWGELERGFWNGEDE